MKSLIKFSAWIVLLLLTSCGTPRIDEKSAAKIVQEKLLASNNTFAQKIKNGASAKKFLVTDGSKKYVVRFIQNRSKKALEQEIYNWKIAGDGGYGPKIYFRDPSKGILIMEYLPSQKITYQDLQSDKIYIALAHLLQKIHHGPEFKNSYDPFRRIRHAIQINKSKYKSIPLDKVEHILTIIHEALSLHLTTSPSHNDLHRGNLMFFENEFKAIDYENAAPDDPYFDVATVSTTTLSFINPSYKKVLLENYLGRTPSAKEKAKLFLMEQVVWTKTTCDHFHSLSPEKATSYESIQAPPILEIIQKALEGKFDTSQQENKLIALKAQLNILFDNFASEEFQNAVNILKE